MAENFTGPKYQGEKLLPKLPYFKASQNVKNVGVISDSELTSTHTEYYQDQFPPSEGHNQNPPVSLSGWCWHADARFYSQQTRWL